MSIVQKNSLNVLHLLFVTGFLMKPVKMASFSRLPNEENKDETQFRLCLEQYLSLSLSSSGEQASKGARELCANHCDNELRSSVEGKVHVEYM